MNWEREPVAELQGKRILVSSGSDIIKVKQARQPTDHLRPFPFNKRQDARLICSVVFLPQTIVDCDR